MMSSTMKTFFPAEVCKFEVLVVPYFFATFNPNYIYNILKYRISLTKGPGANLKV